MSDTMTKAFQGGRFKNTKPTPLDEIKRAPGTLRSHRLAIEAALKHAAHQVAKLKRDLGKGEIGAERFERERAAAMERPLKVLQSRYDTAREISDSALAGFEIEWNDIATLGRMASRDGSLAMFLKALPDDARDAQVQGFISRGEHAKATDAALLFPELRAEVLAAIELPNREARTFAAAAAREMRGSRSRASAC